MAAEGREPAARAAIARRQGRKIGKSMETVWDWLTVIAFGGLVVLMLNRSTQEKPIDHLAQYLVPAAGCAIANYIGNNHSDIVAGLCLVLVAVYVYKVLKWPPAHFLRGGSQRDRRDD
jgi:hypothetical protein